MVRLTAQECQVIMQVIYSCRYTPEEWENVVKPIVAKLQAGDVDGD